MKVINIFGGPGCGKSTLAAGLFHQMKLADFNCELVTEFAKDLTWERSPTRLCQPYVFGIQYLRLQRLIGQVDYAITDSPLLLSCYYGGELPESFHKSIIDFHHTFENLNYILTWPQDRSYKQVGRNQNELEACTVHNQIWQMLNDYEIKKQPIYPDARGVKIILEDIRAIH